MRKGNSVGKYGWRIAKLSRQPERIPDYTCWKGSARSLGGLSIDNQSRSRSVRGLIYLVF